MNLHPPRHMQAIKWNYMTNRKLKSIKIHKPKANSRPEVNKDHSEIEETERNPIKKSQQNTEVEISKHPTWSRSLKTKKMKTLFRITQINKGKNTWFMNLGSEEWCFSMFIIWEEPRRSRKGRSQAMIKYPTTKSGDVRATQHGLCFVTFSKSLETK